MNKLFTYVAIIALAIGFTVSSVAQSTADGVIVSRLLDEKGDTVLISRTPDVWRIGPALSSTLHFNFGKLIMPMNNQFPGHGYYKLNAGGVGGGGFGLGFVFDYQEPNEVWGFAFLANMYDYRSTTTYTHNPALPTNPEFALDGDIITSIGLEYVNFMPQVRYNINEYPGLHMLMGLDFDILVGKKATRTETFYESERIDQQYRISFEPNKFRAGINVGAGWDLLGGVWDEWRMTLTPFALVQMGTNGYSKNGSNWNDIYLRTGVALKFGEDQITDTLIKRDPNYQDPQAPAIAQQNDKLNVVMPESKGMFIAMLIPDLTGPDQNLPDYTKTIGSDKTPPIANKMAPAKITPNKQQIFSTYTTPFDTSLSSQLKNYLDGVADFMSANPRAEVRIVGHADNFGGSPTETQRVSDERALQIVRYLTRKGISRDRLLASGLGARKPIQDNRTPKGRSANRRVEITIVQ